MSLYYLSSVFACWKRAKTGWMKCGSDANTHLIWASYVKVCNRKVTTKITQQSSNFLASLHSSAIFTASKYMTSSKLAVSHFLAAARAVRPAAYLHDVISIPGILERWNESLRKMLLELLVACEIEKVINESISACIRQLTAVLTGSLRRDDLAPIVVTPRTAVPS